MTERDDAPEIDPKDLDVVESLADEGKDAEDIWNEYDAAEAGAPAEVPQDDESHDDEPPAEVEAQDAPAGDDGADEGDKTDDPWAEAPARLKEAHEKALAAERARLEHDAKSQRGRIAALQRRLQEVRDMEKQPPSKARVSVDEARKRLSEEYPEIAEPLMQLLAPIQEQLAGHEKAEQSRRKADLSEIQDRITTQARIVEETHPGWTDFLKKNGAAFMAWVDDQPKAVREAARRNSENIWDAQETNDILAKFKTHLAGGKPAPASQPEPKAPSTHQLNDRRARQLNATASPRSGRRPAVSGIPEDGDPQAIWDAFDRMEAQQR